jgi:endonuclease YncB( thermonuclease family)
MPALASLALSLFLALAPARAAKGASDPGAPVPSSAVVVAVYDGDTVTLDTGDKVRLRWVNTPELKPAEAYGIEGREAAAALLLNKKVQLVYGQVKRDGYGRLIAGMRTEAGEDLSTHLLELGYGHLFVIPPDDSDLTPLIEAQERARKGRRGIWSDERYQGELHITSFHANADGDDRENPHGEYLRVCNVSPRPLDLQGYKLTDINGSTWTLPELILPPGNTVKIISGKGANQPDPASQLEIYLQTDGPVWNNAHDRATLYDRYGKVVDAREHAPKNVGKQ